MKMHVHCSFHGLSKRSPHGDQKSGAPVNVTNSPENSDPTRFSTPEFIFQRNKEKPSHRTGQRICSDLANDTSQNSGQIGKSGKSKTSENHAGKSSKKAGVCENKSEKLP